MSQSESSESSDPQESKVTSLRNFQPTSFNDGPDNRDLKRGLSQLSKKRTHESFHVKRNNQDSFQENSTNKEQKVAYFSFHDIVLEKIYFGSC